MRTFYWVLCAINVAAIFIPPVISFVTLLNVASALLCGYAAATWKSA